MKVKSILVEMFTKAGVEITPDIEQALSRTEDIELPEEISNVPAKLLTKEAAKSNKELEAFFESRTKTALSKKQIKVLEKAGFTEAQIKELEKLDIAERTQKIIEIQQLASGANTNASIEEVSNQYKTKLNELEAKLSAKDKALLDKEQYYLNKLEETKNEIDFNGLLSTFNFKKDGLPKERVIQLVKEDVHRLLEHMGAKLYFINGYPKLYNSADTSLEFYDENGNPVDGKQLIFSVAEKLNVIEKAQSAQNQVGLLNKTVQLNPGVQKAAVVNVGANRVSDLIKRIKG